MAIRKERKKRAGPHRFCETTFLNWKETAVESQPKNRQSKTKGKGSFLSKPADVVTIEAQGNYVLFTAGLQGIPTYSENRFSHDGRKG